MFSSRVCLLIFRRVGLFTPAPKYQILHAFCDKVGGDIKAHRRRVQVDLGKVEMDFDELSSRLDDLVAALVMAEPCSSSFAYSYW